MATPTRDLPDTAQLHYVKCNAGMQWKDLARMLGFDQQLIGVFEYKHKDPRESCMEMLETWHQTTGVDGTVAVLKEALEKAGLKIIADCLDEHKAPEVLPSMVYYSIPSDSLQRLTDNLNRSHSTSTLLAPAMWQEGVGKAVEILVGVLGGTVPGLRVPSSQESPVLAAASTGAHDLSGTAEGTGNGSSESQLHEERLKFHPKLHGNQICIESNGTVAKSLDSFNNSICFSELPIKVGEKINLKIIVSRTFDESLRFGFTSRDPDSLTVEDLPALSYPTLAQQPGFWIKPLPGHVAHQGCVATFTVDETGNVTFAVDGEDKGLFFSGVDVSQPLWAVVDVHGSAVTVQFVDDQVASEAFDQWIHEGDEVQLWVEDMETLRDMQCDHGGFDAEMKEATAQIGIATRIDIPEDVHVFFPSINKKWRLSPAALRKVKRPDVKSDAIVEGDLVKVTADLEKLKSAHLEEVTWVDDMFIITNQGLRLVSNVQKEHFIQEEVCKKILGKVGRVRRVRPDGNITLRMAGEATNRTIKPQGVEKIENPKDMCAEGLHCWKRGVSRVCVKCKECTTKGANCSMKDKPLRPPGSYCGCSSKDTGCADCGICRSCAGELSEDLEIMVDHNRSMLLPQYEKFLAGKMELTRRGQKDNPNYPSDSGLLDSIDESGLERGDEVKVTLNRGTFQSLQEERGLYWDRDMVQIIGVPGTVTLHLGNHILVYLHNGRWVPLYAGCLTKTHSAAQGEHESLKKGDLVRVIKDEKKLRELQPGEDIGQFKPAMLQCLGKTGCVKKVRKRLIHVEFAYLSGSPMWFHRAAVTAVSSVEEQKAVHHLKRGDCVKVAVDAETFQANQMGHGGYGDWMMSLMETAGVVRHFDIDGDAFICFADGSRRLINPASLEKVNLEDYEGKESSLLKVNHYGKVDGNKSNFKRLQEAIVNWNDGLFAAAGKFGMVTNVDPLRKTVQVHIHNTIFSLNTALVKRATLADMQEHFGQSWSSDFARGDLVRIKVTLDELKSLQEGHGGFKDDMKKVMKEVGSVCFIDYEGDVHVRFNIGRLCFNPSALTKVAATEDKFYVGDLVHIESDLGRLIALQTPEEHGRFVLEMAALCGATGRLLSIANDKAVKVKVEGRAWFFNPALLRRKGNPTADTAGWKSAAICARGKHDWSIGRCLVCVICGECTEHGKLCFARTHDKTAGSFAGCGEGHAGCDDCGACRTCALEDQQELDAVDAWIKTWKLATEVLQKKTDNKLSVDDTKTPLVKHRQSAAVPEGALEVERKQLQPVLEKMSQAIQLMRRHKDSGSILQVSNSLKDLHNLYNNSTRAGKKLLGDHSDNMGAAEALMEYASFLSSQASMSQGTDDKLLSDCLSSLCNVVCNYAHASTAFGHAVGRSGLLQMTLQELEHRQKMEQSEVKGKWMWLLLCIMVNCARVPENFDYFRDIGAVDVLKQNLENEGVRLRMVTLRCLGYIVEAEELDLIQMSSEDVDYFMKDLNLVVGNSQHVEFVRDLVALLRNDGNKHEFVNRGVMKVLVQLVESGDDTVKECAMLCVQRIAVIGSIRDTIVSESKIEDVLRALLVQGQTYGVQATARKTLTHLKNEPPK